MLILNQLTRAAPGSSANEDAIGASQAACWIIDGATAVDDDPAFRDHGTSAAWLSAALNRELGQIDWTRIDVADGLAAVQNRIADQYASIAGSGRADLAAQPSAALALAVAQDWELVLAGLGDCRVLVQRQTGPVFEFVPLRRPPDDAILKERQRLLEGEAHGDPWPKLRQYIRTVRSTVNTGSGYSAVHVTRPWASLVTMKTIPLASPTSLLMISDGFYRLVDVFNALTGEQLLARAMRDGLGPLYDDLRKMEQHDSVGAAYPRIKCHDDVSAVLVSCNADALSSRSWATCRGQ